MRTSIWKRTLSLVLALAMVLSLVPAMGLAQKAEAAENRVIEDLTDENGNNVNYITMPITIRDFAADGMLFEWNEVDTDKGTETTVTETNGLTHTTYEVDYNPYYWDRNSTGTATGSTEGYKGLRIYSIDWPVYDTNYDQTETNGAWWYVLVLNAKGDVIKVLDLESPKEDVDTVLAGIEGAAYSLWAWRDSSNVEAYSLLETVYADYAAALAKYDNDEAKAIAALAKHRFVLTGLAGSGNSITATLQQGRYYENEVLKTATKEPSENGYDTDPYKTDARGVYLFNGNAIAGYLGGLDAYNGAWHAVVYNASTGAVVDVVPKIPIDGTESENPDRKSLALSGYVNSSYKIVMVWDTDENAEYRDLFTCITDDTASEYTIVETDSTFGGSVLSVTRTRTFVEADTKAFGLLATSDSDYLDVLDQDDEDAIYGSEFISQGGWNSEDEPEAYKAKLYSSDDRTNHYATQDVYGATIRTNLVDKGLDVNGNPLYTPETVMFLAEYMAQIMEVPEQNDDGTYNSYFVTGVKLFDASWNYIDPGSPLAVYTLADLIRMTMDAHEAETIEKYGDTVGTYEDARAKFEAGNLQYAYQAYTWCEVAYFLLHSTWNDSVVDMRSPGRDGYGYPIDRYDSLHMIETTNEDGETCYVFNARFDDTVYNYNDGQIFNTQLESYTAAPYGDDGLYIGGILLPRDRFDPLGTSAADVELGYGLSGNTYGDMTGHSDTQSWAEYYDTTNYNMSLEGHAQFVYHKDANQYFIFTGDDDVYLYINGIRVLDIGGGHSISKVGININDVAEACGLTDGGTYKFDFFYLERHGTAANFGIETNIQMADPAMTTMKTGYQNGASTGYNGFVDPNTKVAYSFNLRNDSDVSIDHLTFDDPAIGVYFGYDKVTMNTSSSYDEMYMYLFNPDGSVKNSWGISSPSGVALDAQTIMAVLTTGLKAGEMIGIYGFKYLIPENAWDAEDTFSNTVYTTAQSKVGNKTVELHGMDDWKVQKLDVVFKPFHVYDWVHKDARDADWKTPVAYGDFKGGSVNVTQEELARYLVENDVDISGKTLTTVLCTASGDEDQYYVNQCAEVQSDGSITYTGAKPGMDTVFYKIKGAGYDDVVFNYDVFTYGTMDNIYVLDYGLKVELNGDDFGFRANDHLEVPQNIYKPEAAITGLTDPTSHYGNFTYEEDYSSVVYTPNKIINHTDSFTAGIQVLEELPEGVTLTEDNLKFYGVDMYETVTTAPASVVYYENDFPGITYVSKKGNNWVHFETVNTDGTVIEDDFQSADQDSNYGSDPNYDEDNYGEWTKATEPNEITETEEEPALIVPEGEETTEVFQADGQTLNTLERTAGEAINRFLGIGGADSNGSVSILKVNSTEEVMYFEFKGTGFEILSRTTDEAYAVILVQVQKKNSAGEYELAAYKPVITESIGGDLYQVPIISITGLAHGEYRVVVTAAAGTDDVTRVLYIDGIRIYNPLTSQEALEYYRPEEAAAKFYEVRQMILKESSAEAAYFLVARPESDETEESTGLDMVMGTTMIEDVDGDCVLTAIETVDQYMKCGPNNELYLDSTQADLNMVAFYVKPDLSVAPEARTLQIGAHRKVESLQENLGYVNLVYGSTADQLIDAEFDADGNCANGHQITTGTEMYYTIDVGNLLADEEGRYLVMIGSNASENDAETLALTNLKVSGYIIQELEPIVEKAYKDENLQNLAIIAEAKAIYQSMKEYKELYPETEEDGEYEEYEIEETELTESEDIEETEEAEEEVTGPEQIDSAMALIQSIL